MITDSPALIALSWCIRILNLVFERVKTICQLLDIATKIVSNDYYLLLQL